MSLGHSSNIHEPKPTGSAGGGSGANLTYTRNANSVTVVSDTGTDAAIPGADSSNAGVMTSAQVVALTAAANPATASQAEAEAGSVTVERMFTPQRIAQAIAALAPSGGTSITVQDEGTPLATAMTTLNVTGAGATVTGTGAVKTLNIPGAGTATITVKEGGVDVSTVITALDFLGADFDITESPSGEANIVINSSLARSASPTFTGTPTAPTAAPGTNTTQLSTTAFVQAAVAALINSAPGALDTLDELAAAMGDDANFAATMTTALAGKQPIDATLTALAALTIAANSLSVGSGTDAFSQVTFAANTFPGRSSTGNLVAKPVTDFAFSLLDDADAATARTTLGAQSTAAPSSTGLMTSDGANITTANAMGALVVDTTKGLNTKSVAADSTFTFSAQPATANTWFQLAVTNTDTAAHILTFPSAFSLATNAARTTCPIPASGRVLLTFRWNGSAYEVFGDTGFLNNFTATSDPTVNDDIADGYGPGSLFGNTTSGNLFWCESNAAGAAIWNAAGTGGGGSGDMILASVQTVTGAKTFAATKLLIGGSTSGAVTLDAPAAAGAGTVVLPLTGTLSTLAGTETLSGKIIQLAALPGTDDTYQGQVITGRNAGATIAQWDAVYLDSSGTWQLADANGSGTFPCRGLAVAAYSSSNAATVIDNGVARNDAWAWTIGGDVYLSTTAGGLTQTAPSASGDKVQKIGYALTADSIRVFIGTGEYLTIT